MASIARAERQHESPADVVIDPPELKFEVRPRR
jgi:hypothetical protein